MANTANAPIVHQAVVARRPLDREDLYLQLGAEGSLGWTRDPDAATTFPSMREAARMAFRLPSEFKAYGLPREVEVDVARSVH